MLCGGSFPKRLTFKQLQKQAQKDLIHIDHGKIYGHRLKEPILGHHYNVPERTTQTKDIKFDTTFPYVRKIASWMFLMSLVLQIPVYQHLIMPQPNPVQVPETPPGIPPNIKVDDAEI